MSTAIEPTSDAMVQTARMHLDREPPCKCNVCVEFGKLDPKFREFLLKHTPINRFA